MVWAVIFDTSLKAAMDQPRILAVFDALKLLVSSRSNTTVTVLPEATMSCSSTPVSVEAGGGTKGAGAREKVRRYSRACGHHN